MLGSELLTYVDFDYSDLSGCDNIWIMDRSDPSEAIQLTHEPYHLVSYDALCSSML